MYSIKHERFDEVYNIENKEISTNKTINTMKFSLNSFNPFRALTNLEKANIELEAAESALFQAVSLQEYYESNIEYNTKRIARLKEFLSSKDFKR